MDLLSDSSAVTYVTDATTIYRAPTTVGMSYNSSKLELTLDFLAKELELERQRREKLQNEVHNLTQIITQQ